MTASDLPRPLVQHGPQADPEALTGEGDDVVDLSPQQSDPLSGPLHWGLPPESETPHDILSTSALATGPVRAAS